MNKSFGGGSSHVGLWSDVPLGTHGILARPRGRMVPLATINPVEPERGEEIYVYRLQGVCPTKKEREIHIRKSLTKKLAVLSLQAWL